MRQGSGKPASEAQHPQSEVGGGGGAWVQVRLSGRPHPFRRENRVGQGRLCRATGPGVRGDNKQGPVSRDRREGRYSNELPGASPLLPRPRAGPTAPGGREQLVPNTPPATAPGHEVLDISLRPSEPPARPGAPTSAGGTSGRRQTQVCTVTQHQGQAALQVLGPFPTPEMSSCTRAWGRSKLRLPLQIDDHSPLPGGDTAGQAPSPRKAPGCLQQQDDCGAAGQWLGPTTTGQGGKCEASTIRIPGPPPSPDQS